MKTNLKIAAILIPAIIAILMVPVSHYSHNYVIGKSFTGDKEAASVKGNFVKEIWFTINDLKK